MVIRECLAALNQAFREYGIENSMFESNLLMREILKLSPLDLVLSHQKELSKEEKEKITAARDRRLSGEPLQYILGTQEFMGLEFIVTPDVLIPRSDTETLVEAVLSERRGMNVLELCAGSGCIAVSLAHFNPGAYVRSVDISEPALAVAKRNAEKNHVSDRVRFEKMDILTEKPCGVYDVIVSNPPYIEHDVLPMLQREVFLHEPHLALDGGADGMVFYRRIAELAPGLLQEHGSIYLEVGEKQAKKVAALLESQRLKTEIIYDLCGVERVVIGRK